VYVVAQIRFSVISYAARIKVAQRRLSYLVSSTSLEQADEGQKWDQKQTGERHLTKWHHSFPCLLHKRAHAKLTKAMVLKGTEKNIVASL